LHGRDNEQDSFDQNLEKDRVEGEGAGDEGLVAGSEGLLAGEEIPCEERLKELTGQLETCETSLSSLELRLRELQDAYLRSRADFDNYRKRMRREQEELVAYRAWDLAERLVPVLDDFERALSTEREFSPSAGMSSAADLAARFQTFVDGVEMIYRRLLGVLAEEEILPFGAVGDPFDPFRHEAIFRVETEELPPETLAQVFEKGYIYKEKVLRPARVAVASPPKD